MPLLEVIALDAADARAAEEGGADRIEVVADMSAAGLTPDPAVLTEIRKATSLPLRVMLRANAGFRTDTEELAGLRRQAGVLVAAGADGFVLGFLDPMDWIDIEAATQLSGLLPWTFHRAVDHAEDRVAAWETVRALPGLDQVLTSGHPDGVGSGLQTLLDRAAGGDANLIMAGGGLLREHVPVLAEAGITAFHVGSAVRAGGSWDKPIDTVLVREWVDLVRH
ncbi:MAG: copper homeostasis protein CutC [Streptosporangiaceae bacterium]